MSSPDQALSDGANSATTRFMSVAAAAQLPTVEGGAVHQRRGAARRVSQNRTERERQASPLRTRAETGVSYAHGIDDPNGKCSPNARMNRSRARPSLPASSVPRVRGDEPFLEIC